MADHIPFITSEDSGALVRDLYHDSAVVRVPLGLADKFPGLAPQKSRIWLDPCVDGMDDIESRRVIKRKDAGGVLRTTPNPWFTMMSKFPCFEGVGTSLTNPVASDVSRFVHAVLDECARCDPAWITVPQMPLVYGAERNKVNRLMASASGKWKSNSGFGGLLILPLVFTNHGQISGKTVRNPKVRQAERCYHEAQAGGFWVVDSDLTEEDGSATLRNKRFRCVIDLHEEVNARISSEIRVAGPYWGLNLVLWARGLVDYPAIGIGYGYQFFMAGGPSRQPSAKLALPSLRRRVGVGPKLKTWLDIAITKVSPSHPAHAQLSYLRKHYAVLSAPDPARGQVAKFYKEWFQVIAPVPKAGRSMALFQDLSAAYALGKSLPDLGDKGTARRPEAVAEPLMLNCL